MASSLLKLCDRIKEENRLSRAYSMANDDFHGKREFRTSSSLDSKVDNGRGHSEDLQAL